MGLDQTLNWIGKPPTGLVERLHHKNLSELDRPIMMNYVGFDEWNSKCYKNIEKYMIPEEVYQNTCDWNLIKQDCGVPLDSNICGIGSSSVTFGKAVNVEPTQTFHLNLYDKRYWKPELVTLHFFLEDEVYRWRNNYEVQEIFNKAFPEEYCEYKQKYEIVNCGHYKLTTPLLKEIKRTDKIFADKYEDGIKNIFYSANW